MRRAARIIGSLFVMHGLAHALWGLQSANRAVGWVSGGSEGSALALWLVTLLWSLAMGGFLFGGFGLLGARPLHRHWLSFVIPAAAASLLLLLGFRPPILLPGLVLDIAVLGGVWWWRPRPLAAVDLGPRARPTPLRRAARGVLSTATMAIAAGFVLLVLMRPLHMRWGSTDDELRAALPGDELVPEPVSYAVQHAMTINAPADSIWPWLAQIGQDRAGFYSYTVLENLIGLGITNADHIHPEWQDVSEGDTIHGGPRRWLGLPGRPGWRVMQVVPGRALFLEDWGQFVLVPVDSETARLVLRSRRGGDAGVLGFLYALGALVIELPQFIMERGMLLGVKERAERAAGS